MIFAQKKTMATLLWVLLFLQVNSHAQPGKKQPRVQLDSITWVDAARNRPIPVAFYVALNKKPVKQQQLVILNHGYNMNQPGGNLGYSAIAEHLAAHGYFVASIQHELPTDSLLPSTGIPQIVRRTNWERGVLNIVFVIAELKKKFPLLDYQHITLIGHSNGGDMAMLLAQQYPQLIDKVISLDNRRVALPRTESPRIYSIRSSDQPADEGVLPTPAEMKKFNITIVKLPATIHNDMDDSGTAAQRSEINAYIERFLQEKIR